MVCSKTGAMMGVGVHGVAIIRALCGDEPTVVNATALWAVEHRGGTNGGCHHRTFTGNMERQN